MLRALRKGISSWLFKILFVLLVASFALWGIEDIFTGGGEDPVVAEAGETDILADDLGRALQTRRNAVREQLGGQLTAEIERELDLLNQSLDQLITELLIAQVAADAGLRLSQESLVEIVRSQEVFRGADGSFSQPRLQNLLFRAGLTEQQYLEGVQTDFARTRVLNALTAGVSPPDVLGELLYRHANQQRQAAYFSLSIAGFGLPPAPDDDTLRAFYNANLDRYALPEYRSGKAVGITIDRLAQEIEVAEDRVRQAYAEQRQALGRDETRTLRQVVVADEAQAVAIAAAAADAGSLAMALDAMEQAPALVDFGAVSRVALPVPELADAAFSLEEPGLAGPVQTALGWHVIEVTEIEAGDIPDFADVRDRLAAELASRDAFDAVYELSEEFEDMVAGGASLAEAAEQFSLPLIDIPPVDNRGRRKTGSLVTVIADFPEVGEEFFDAPPGEPSPPVETREGDYFFVTVELIEPARVQSFEEVREDVAQAWQRAERERFALEQAEALAARIREGEPMAEIAAERGTSVSETRLFSRSNANIVLDLTPALIEGMFALDAVGDVTIGLNRDAVTVLQLTALEPVEPDNDPQTLDQIQAQLTTANRLDLLDAYDLALRDRYGVRINRQSLRTFFPEWFPDAEPG